jgi:Protein of unknown function (DUF3558)
MTMTTLFAPRSVTIAFTTAGCLLLAACGSSTPASPSAAAPNASANQATAAANPAGAVAAGNTDPCSLLTQTEVDTAVGQPLGPPDAGAQPNSCQWSTADFTAGVDITVGDWDSIKGAAIGGGADHQPVSISGVGDDALDLNSSNGSNLYVRKADTGFFVSINGPHIDSLPDHGLAQEKVLAAAVLSRL